MTAKTEILLHMLAAVAQLTSGNVVLENLGVAVRLVERAARAGARVS